MTFVKVKGAIGVIPLPQIYAVMCVGGGVELKGLIFENLTSSNNVGIFSTKGTDALALKE